VTGIAVLVKRDGRTDVDAGAHENWAG